MAFSAEPTLSKNFPAPYIVPPTETHTHTIIFLHGRNSNGADFAEELFEGSTISAQPFIDHAAFRSCKWVFPNASSTYSEQFQEDLAEWFDLASTSNPYAEYERQMPGLRASVGHISTIIEQELKSLPSSHIILGGISQGFATAIHVLLSHQYALGGFVGVSGWLPFCSQISTSQFEWFKLVPQDYSAQTSNLVAKIDTPVLITHCEDDDVVDFQLGKDACSTLRNLGAQVTWIEYQEGGHSIQDPDGYDAIQRFIANIIREG